ncbi:MFS transporter [Undibacterium sp.]|uniref:MFS transporter n=1 Tax=Undibacterium sp. TaxID=1914977 RepID=UPI0025E036AB|nr:MFS transporter [Undibacterium sp.]
MKSPTLMALAYGLLGMPLAMSALPVYVQIPAYYTTQLGLPLASTGLVLFFARLLDTVQDPLLGRMIDRHQNNIALWLIAAAALLAAAFFGLWLPPAFAVGSGLLMWLGLMLVLAYSAHSLLNIAYLSWGARLSQDSDTGKAQTSLLGAAAWREGLSLAGLILASLIPSFILQQSPSQVKLALNTYAIGFAILLALALASLLLYAPTWKAQASSTNPNLRVVLANPLFRRLLPIYFINSLSVSIPATLALFFINDRIQAPQLSGYFLALYFITGAIGLPLWIKLAKRYGCVAAWKLGMLLAILSFVGCSFLSSGDVGAYFLICAAAGLALGADLALPPVLLAEIIPAEQPAASYYGFWTLLGKLALAISGLGLPLLALLQYQPGQASHSASLVLLYAALPCVLKLIALRLLHRYPS